MWIDVLEQTMDRHNFMFFDYENILVSRIATAFIVQFVFIYFPLAMRIYSKHNYEYYDLNEWYLLYFMQDNVSRTKIFDNKIGVSDQNYTRSILIQLV